MTPQDDPEPSGPAALSEEILVAAVLRGAVKDLTHRVNALHAAGYIDAQIKAELLAELEAAQLSAADIAADGEVAAPVLLRVKIAAYERLTWYGRPGFIVGAPPTGTPEHAPAPPPGTAARLIGFKAPTLFCEGSGVT